MDIFLFEHTHDWVTLPVYVVARSIEVDNCCMIFPIRHVTLPFKTSWRKNHIEKYDMMYGELNKERAHSVSKVHQLHKHCKHDRAPTAVLPPFFRPRDSLSHPCSPAPNRCPAPLAASSLEEQAMMTSKHIPFDVLHKHWHGHRQTSATIGGRHCS